MAASSTVGCRWSVAAMSAPNARTLLTLLTLFAVAAGRRATFPGGR